MHRASLGSNRTSFDHEFFRTEAPVSWSLQRVPTHARRQIHRGERATLLRHLDNDAGNDSIVFPAKPGNAIADQYDNQQSSIVVSNPLKCAGEAVDIAE